MCRKEDVPRDSVPRETCAQLSMEATWHSLWDGFIMFHWTQRLRCQDFWEKYEKPGKVCMISGVPEKEGWPVEWLERGAV